MGVDVAAVAAINAARMSWNSLAYRAYGVILTYLSPTMQEMFEEHDRLENLLNALLAWYGPDRHQELERLERKLSDLVYDGSDQYYGLQRSRHWLPS